MFIRLLVIVVPLLVSGCGPSEPPPDPRQNPVARDYNYYKENPAEADAQKLICNEIPSQARSKILEGNCVFVDRALRMRGFGDKEVTILTEPEKKPATLPPIPE